MRDAITQPRDVLAAEVVAWRRERLAGAGFGAGPAQALAQDRRIDVHALIDLTERGCQPELAARILAPLDPPAHGPPMPVQARHPRPASGR